MATESNGSRQIGLVVGRAFAAALVLGIAWLAGRGSVVADALAALDLHSGLLADALGQDVPLRMVVGRGVVGIMAGILAKLVLPQAVSLRMLFCLAAGIVAEVLVASLAGPLGISFAPDLSFQHLSVTAGATLLVVFGGHLLLRF